MFPSCIKSEHRFLTQKKVVILPTKTALKMSSILRIRQLCVVIFSSALLGGFFMWSVINTLCVKNPHFNFSIQERMT